MGLYSDKLETLIKAALVDGELTDKERQVLMRKAAEEGIDQDEFEMVLNAKVTELEAAKQKTKMSTTGTPRKCPACGAIVPALAVSCPECGFEFSGINASSSSQQLLSKQIAEIKKTTAARKKEVIASGKYSTQKHELEVYSEQERVLNDLDDTANDQICSLVKSFPIPNAKEELFDLVLFLKSQGYDT